MNVNNCQCHYYKQIDPFVTFGVSLKHKLKQEHQEQKSEWFHYQVNVLNVKTTVSPQLRVRVTLFLSVMIPGEITQAFFFLVLGSFTES